MSNKEGFEYILNTCRATIVQTMQEAQSINSWLMFSEDDEAVSKIATIALGMILNNMPTPLAIAYSIKVYHELLEES